MFLRWVFSVLVSWLSLVVWTGEAVAGQAGTGQAETGVGQAGSDRVLRCGGVSDSDWDAVWAALRERRAGGDEGLLTVELPAGVFRLSATLKLGPEEVGEGLEIRGAREGRTVLHGARGLDFVERRDDGRWVYALPADWDASRLPRVMLIDGELRTAARHPNRSFMRVDEVAEDRRSGFSLRADEWEQVRQADPATGPLDLVFLHDWSTSRLPVARMEPEGRWLTTVGPIGCSAPHYAINHFEPHPRFWLEGHPSFADIDGEWYVDAAARQVVLVANVEAAEEGADVVPPRVELPMLEQLLVAAGEAEPLGPLRVVGLTFTGCDFVMPPGGMATAQATMHEPRERSGTRQTSNRPMLPAAVQIDFASQTRVEGCRFVDLGGTGLWLGGRTRGCEITGCEFERTGGNGVNLGEDRARQVDGRSWADAAPEQVPTGNLLLDCRITQPGVVMSGAVAVWASLHHGLEISGNTISQTPYTGISLGWIWNDSTSPARENHVHDNRIEYVMRVLSDGGGIYTLGRQPGTVIENNEIEGVAHAAGRAESNGMFLDEGTTEFTIRGNTIRGVAQSPLRFHRAGKNRVVGNRWELNGESTPPVRYNNTPEANVELVDNRVLESPRRIYLIGNSLTWDTLPNQLAEVPPAATDKVRPVQVKWHVDCGKSLPFIDHRPLAPCVASSLVWPDALRRGVWDTIVVQPFYGSTLAEDVAVIDEWMRMQPTADVVLHTGWARATDVRREYFETPEDASEMTHHEVYFERLLAALRERHPQRRITRTQAMDVLARIARDIDTGKAPFEKLETLYRDAIHMTHALGRPMMHQVMRHAVGLDVQPLTGSRPEVEYLNGVLAALGVRTAASAAATP